VSARHERSDAVNIVVVTGMSGSGKTTATNALEDDGFYCIDNLPTELVPQFVELCQRSRAGMKKVALGLDLRDLSYAEQWPQVRAQLETDGHDVTVVFLEASDDVLIRRYSETRRAHPLGHGRSLPEAIVEERSVLGPLREAADVIISTSDASVHDLKHRIHDVISGRPSDDRLSVTVRSFGFKYGTVSDADLVFDVRFLPNPYFVKEMRDKTGLDADVAGYVLDRDQARGFVDRLTDMLDFLLPLYVDEGRSYLTIAIGCTGGRHRSVSIAERITAHLAERGHSVIARHRDIDRQRT
jgi:UPF0042 nucleotide-binding protein